MHPIPKDREAENAEVTSKNVQWLRRYAPTQPDILACSKMLNVCDENKLLRQAILQTNDNLNIIMAHLSPSDIYAMKLVADMFETNLKLLGESA